MTAPGVFEIPWRLAQKPTPRRVGPQTHRLVGPLTCSHPKCQRLCGTDGLCGQHRYRAKRGSPEGRAERRRRDAAALTWAEWSKRRASALSLWSGKSEWERRACWMSRSLSEDSRQTNMVVRSPRPVADWVEWSGQAVGRCWVRDRNGWPWWATKTSAALFKREARHDKLRSRKAERLAGFDRPTGPKVRAYRCGTDAARGVPGPHSTGSEGRSYGDCEHSDSPHEGQCHEGGIATGGVCAVVRAGGGSRKSGKARRQRQRAEKWSVASPKKIAAYARIVRMTACLAFAEEVRAARRRRENASERARRAALRTQRAPRWERSAVWLRVGLPEAWCG